MTARLATVLTVLQALIFWPASTVAEEIRIGFAQESVVVTPGFVGADVIVFGSVESGLQEDLEIGRYDVIVVLQGDEEKVVVRRKSRQAGIWVNGRARTFENVPSFYALASSRPLSEIAEPEVFSKYQIGFSNLTLISATEDEALPLYRNAITRIRRDRDLALERQNGIRFMSDTLFRAKLVVPSNVPIGRHTVKAFLFKRGELLDVREARFAVRKVGFEQYTYWLAHKHGLIYGIIAVLIAMATGWLASVVFRKD